MNIDFAERIRVVPDYVFAEIDRIVKEKKLAGINVINLGIGDPDLPPPRLMLEALQKEAADIKNHGYSSSRGEPEFIEAVSEWMKERFGVYTNPKTELVALIGSKEGIADISRAFVNLGDRVLVPDPAYPAYVSAGALLNGGVPVPMPLLEENSFLPDLEAMDGVEAKMMFLNYPNNPTGATTDKGFLKKVVDFALENNIFVCYDNAYSEITYENYKAPSILEVDGGMDAAIEFHSFSKTFNMAGDRLAFAVGNSKLIDGLTRVKSMVDSGPPKYIQRVGICGLHSYVRGEPPEEVKNSIETYHRRVKLLVNGLQNAGLECKMPCSTFYVWAKCGCDSAGFTQKLVEAGVVATPGISFGKNGERYIRFSATKPMEDIREACERIAKVIS